MTHTSIEFLLLKQTLCLKDLHSVSKNSKLYKCLKLIMVPSINDVTPPPSPCHPFHQIGLWNNINFWQIPPKVDEVIYGKYCFSKKHLSPTRKLHLFEFFLTNTYNVNLGVECAIMMMASRGCVASNSARIDYIINPSHFVHSWFFLCPPWFCTISARYKN